MFVSSLALLLTMADSYFSSTHDSMHKNGAKPHTCDCVFTLFFFVGENYCVIHSKLY